MLVNFEYVVTTDELRDAVISPEKVQEYIRHSAAHSLAREILKHMDTIVQITEHRKEGPLFCGYKYHHQIHAHTPEELERYVQARIEEALHNRESSQ